MRHIYLVFAVLLLAANTACAASFDCDKAGAKVEKMICADAELSKLDEKLNKKYQTTLKEPPGFSNRNSQNIYWLKERDRCPDIACLRYKYRQQLAYVENPLTLKAEYGFDCSKARSAYERYSCGEDIGKSKLKLFNFERVQLGQLDDELNTVYREALTKYFDSELLRKEQKAWLKARERCAKDIHCGVSALYRDRIYNLRYAMAYPPKTKEEKDNARLLSMASPMGDNFHIAYQPDFKGYGQAICEAMVRWMNHTTPKGNVPFGPSPAFLLPGLTEPEWQEIDIHKYKNLFIDYLKAKRKFKPAQKVQEEVEYALAGNYRLWMLKEDVFADYEPEILVTYSGNRGDKFKHPPLLADKDMQGIDKMYSAYPAGDGIMRYYKEYPYFIGSLGGTGFYIKSDRGTCEITNSIYDKGENQ